MMQKRINVFYNPVFEDTFYFIDTEFVINTPWYGVIRWLMSKQMGSW